MSIASEITRLQGVKADILTAIADKGVTVPVGSALDDCPDLIASISGSAPEPIVDPSITTHLYIEKVSGVVGQIVGPSIGLDDTIEFTISPVADIKAADYAGAYGDIAHLLLIGNGSTGTTGIKIGYYYGSIAIMSSMSGYTPNFTVSDLLQDNLYNFKIKKDKIIFNQTEHTISVFDRPWSYFQYPNMNWSEPAIRFYELKFLDANGTPTRRFVPAKNSSNDTGLYECYSGVFYRCSGNPTLGPEMPL